MIGTTLALAIGAIAGGASSVAAAKMGSNAAKSAAQQQTDAANHSADLQYKATQEATQLQRDMFNKGQENIQPWLESGRGALGQLNSMLGPGGKLMEDFGSFEAPGAFDQSKVSFDPGFQYRMDQSTKALESWRAARGGLLSPGTANKLVRNAQDMTSQEYGAAYQRQYGQYQDAYSRALQAYGTNRDTFMTNQGNTFNRLASLAGVGQQAAGQENALGSELATNVGNIGISTARGIGETGEAAAAAGAAGTVGSSNSWMAALQNIGNNFSNSALLASILGRGGAKYGPQPGDQSFVGPVNFSPGYAR